MIRFTLTVLLICIAGNAAALAAEVRRSDGKTWATVPAVLVSEIPDFTPQPRVKLSKYGGLASRKVKATGFFRTEKIDDRWWLVDPDGCLFITVGLNSVNLTQSKGSLEAGGFQSEQAWADTAIRLLTTHGFNTLGCWSAWEAFRDANRLPYTTSWDFMSTFARKLGVANLGFGNWKYEKDCMPIFHPDFEAFCDEHAKKLTATRDDSWLLGHFSDNELPFRPNSLDNYLSLPEGDPGREAARQWWDKRRGQIEQITEADRDAFLEFVARRYYSVVGAAIRKYDPNHIYLGSRVHGKCISTPVFKASAPLDVVSVNYYRNWSPVQKDIEKWSALSGHPVLVTEFYAMKASLPEKELPGAGFRVEFEADRGKFYQNFTIGLLQSPFCIGWHLFKYGGDDDKREIGVVTPQYKPHTELLQMLSELNSQVYPLADFFAKQGNKSLPVSGAAKRGEEVSPPAQE